MHEAPTQGEIVELYGVDATSSDDAWVVGLYRDDGESPGKTLVLHWDGSEWRTITTPDSEAGRAFAAVDALSPTDVWAVGTRGAEGTEEQGAYTLIEHYDGTSWQVIPSPTIGNGSRLLGVSALSTTEVWAVGYRYSRKGNPKALVLHYDGSSWQKMSSVNRPRQLRVLHDVIALSPTDVWAVGYRGYHPLALHYDGTSWDLTSTSSPEGGNAGFRGITAIDASEIWAVGTNQLRNASQTHTQRFDGESWTIIESPNPGPSGSISFHHLAAIDAAASEEVWAVGGHSPPREEQPTGLRPLVIRWDGSSWATIEVPRPDDDGAFLSAVDVLSLENLWAVGWSYPIRRDTSFEPSSDPYILSYSCS